MKHPITSMSDAQLLDALVEHAPPAGKVALREDFAASLFRYRVALQAIPLGGPNSRLLDVGARLYTAPIYLNLLNYGIVSIATKWKTSFTDESLLATFPNGDKVRLEHFDAEVERFPDSDETFDVIICTEVIEHLALDPMHMLAEINRVCQKGGVLIMSTPNAASFSALCKVSAGQHPYSWAPYNGQSTDRHNREYTVRELERAVEAAGFEIVTSETISEAPFSTKEKILAAWYSVPDLIRGKKGLNLQRMGSTSFIVGRKTGAVRDRYPKWLYYDASRGH